MQSGAGLSRRGLLTGAAAMTAIGEVQARTLTPGLEKIRALVFDVQGTCVDFYQPILRAGETINQAKGLTMDWAALSTDWRDLYRDKMDEVIAGKRPWLRVDIIYREALDTLLERHDLAKMFTSAERDDINLLWNHLDPWPDTIEGLTRLRKKFTTTTLSNAAMSTMIEVVKYAGLPYDAILSAELAHSYKPAPAVYQVAVDYLGYKPDEILMVAAHKYDLKGARAFGFHTAFIARPLEFGPKVAANISPEPWFDFYETSLTGLATDLGA